ncbi:hypothetical protein RchiOBHm_Chr6g0258791 [Rosa chinensis]|uniref:Uncharacterized protein n=1 Tax=Rosa chinensis TaxID=74649 RepID=A0A2P6PMP3_ROSCH|nr:hypothetical protein RchiOBHm_Chr6g0258791 [Rosa chinensis]
MQRSIWIVLLPLFLVLLVAVSWVSYCDSDIGNSVRSNFGSALNSVSIKGQALRYKRENNKSVWVCSGKDRLRSLMQQSKFRRFTRVIELEETLQIVQWWLRRWKTLDPAALKQSSVSFFEVEKPETAVFWWARARTRLGRFV